MKISALLLSIAAVCILYVCYADWIDEVYDTLVEDYLGSDYEEVAPFVSSAASGTEEFDSIVEELSKPERSGMSPYVAACVVAAVSAAAVAALRLAATRAAKQGVGARRSKEEMRSLVTDAFGGRRSARSGDDVPLRVIWKGNDLIESSMHCNLRGSDGKARAAVKSLGMCVREDDAGEATSSSSKESAVQRIADIRKIRKLLDSEPEMAQQAAAAVATAAAAANKRDDFPAQMMMTELRHRLESEMSVSAGKDKMRGNAPSQPIAPRRKPLRDEEEEASDAGTVATPNFSLDSLDSEDDDSRPRPESETDSAADPKLMNRIRLLESRLRLEELKNRNWISRMARAEEILQQLNKQVERIERTRPVETLTETLKITSTVTNWMPVTSPRKNLRFAPVKRHPSQYLQPRYESLSEIIRREVGFPAATASASGKRPPSLTKSPLVPALPPASVLTPQPSFLSKFLPR